MALPNHKWKIVKLAGAFIAVLLILAIGLHLWVSYRAERTISEIVLRESKGHLKVSIGKFSLNYRTLKMDLINLRLSGIDTADKTINYQFNASRITMQLKSYWPLIFKKQLDIDSIICLHPSIELFKLPARNKSTLTFSEQIGKLYISIQEVINSLAIKRLEINYGNIKIHDRSGMKDPISLSDIYLSIDNLKIDTTSLNEQSFLFSDNIVFKMGKQSIQWNQGNNRIGFNHVYLNTNTNLIEIDSCYIMGVDSNATIGQFNIGFDSLKLINPDFRTLYLSDNFTMDSIYCVNPAINLNITLKEKNKDSSNSKRLLEDALKNLTGDVSVKHIGVKNADLAIFINRLDKTSSLVSTKNSFSLRDIFINHRDEQPISIGYIDLAIRNYETYTADSLYAIKFDSVHLIKNRLILSNFTMAATPKAKVKIRGSYSIPRFELTNVSWVDILLHKRLIATEAVLHEPNIKIELFKKGIAAKKQSLYGIFSMLEDNFELEKLSILNGNINYRPSKDMLLKLEQVNTSINTRSLLKADNIKDIGEALNYANIQNGTFSTKTSNILLKGIQLKGDGSSVSIQQLFLMNLHPQITIKAEGLNLTGLLFSDRALTAQSIDWQNATIQMTSDVKQQQLAKSDVLWTLKNISGTNTLLYASINGTKANALLDHLSIPSLTYNNSKIKLADGAFIKGKYFKIASATKQATGEDFEISTNGPSFLSKLTYHKTTDRDTLESFITRLKWVNTPGGLSGSNFLITQIELEAPQLKYRSNDSTRRISLMLPANNYWGATTNISIQHIKYDGSNWSAFINHLNTDNLKFTTLTGDSYSELLLRSLEMDSLSINSHTITNFGQLLGSNPSLRLKNISGSLTSPSSIFKLNNLNYDNNTQSLTTGPISYSPNSDRASYVAARKWQSDYIQTQAKGISIQKLDLPGYWTNNKLNAQSITIQQPIITVFRDKRLPFQEGIIKPLPTNMIKTLPIDLNIDSINIQNGSVSYTELYNKTQQEGAIQFTRLNASIYPIKSTNYQPTDSLFIKAEAYLMDASRVQLLMNESYNDSLGTFVINLRMSPADLTILNPLLTSAAAASLLSGQLDTLDMKAIATDHLALGQMTMLYKKLKLSLSLNKEKKRPFLTKLVNFAANGIIKNNNKKKTEPIYFPRNRDRSIFNYWFRMATTGVVRSAGIRKSSKEMRKYRKPLRELRVPEIK